MLVKGDEYLEEAANALFNANADWLVQEQCIARQLAERHERTMKRDIRLEREARLRAEKEAVRLQEEKARAEERIRELEARLAEKQKEEAESQK